MKNAKVSILVPTYNVEQYIEECFNSIIEQTYSDIEIVCVDNGSTDSTIDIIKRYQSKYANIVLICNEKNMGLATSSNIAMDNATGQYFLYLHADDYLKKADAIEKMVACAEENHAEVVSFESESFGCIENPCYNGKRKYEYEGCWKGIDAFLEQSANNDYKCTVWQYLYQREFIEKSHLRYPDGLEHEDMEFTFNMFMCVDRICFLKEVLHGYRIRPTALSQNKSNYVKRILDIYRLYMRCVEKSKEYVCEEQKKKRAVELQLARLHNLFNRYFWESNDAQKSQCFLKLNGAERYMFQIMVDAQNIHLNWQQMNDLKRENDIYLYGAGVYAKKWLHALLECNIELKGIILTEVQEKKTWFGYPVYQVDELCSDLESPITVIIGVSDKYKEEIKMGLKTYDRVKIFE